MLIAPELRALRVDDGPQCTAQAAMHASIAAWRESAPVRAVDEALAAYDAGAELGELPLLEALMTYRGAREYTATFVASVTGALERQPLGHVALRHAHDEERSSLVLSRAGRVTLALETRVRGGSTGEPAQCCVLTDIESRDIVLAGAMEGRLIQTREHADSWSFAVTPLALCRGNTSIRYGRRDVLAIDRIAGCFTTLRLQRRADVPEPARAYDIATGTQIGQASADVATSRRALMIALIGRMERAEDAPVLADVARGAGDPDLRWEAVRECLGLDTATGFRLLGELARRIGDPIRPDARGLHARLLAQHPQLATLEGDARCPG